MANLATGHEPRNQELPQELWEEIGKRIKNHVDMIRFRSTCKSWRSITPTNSPSLFLLNIPPPPNVSQIEQMFRFFITEATGYLYKRKPSSRKTPVIVVFESTQPNSKSRHGKSFYPSLLYPPYGTSGRINNFPKVLDLRRCSLTPLFTTFYLRLARPPSALFGKKVDKAVLEEDWMMTENKLVDKIVLISYNKITKKPTPLKPHYTPTRVEVDIAVVALAPYGELYFLSTQFMEWKLIICDDIINKTTFDDIVKYNDMLWAVGEDGAAYVLDVKSLTMIRVVNPLDEQPCIVIERNKRRLVEASGILYMLAPCRDPINVYYVWNKIKVFRLIGREWVSVKSVGNHIFYVVSGLCFSAVAGRELSLSNNGSPRKGNCVFLDNMSFRGPETWRLGHSLGVYSFENEWADDPIKSDEQLPEVFCSEFFKLPKVRCSMFSDSATTVTCDMLSSVKHDYFVENNHDHRRTKRMKVVDGALVPPSKRVS